MSDPRKAAAVLSRDLRQVLTASTPAPSRALGSAYACAEAELPAEEPVSVRVIVFSA